MCLGCDIGENVIAFRNLAWLCAVSEPNCVIPSEKEV